MQPQVVQPRSTLFQLVRALGTGFKRPGAVSLLPPVALMLPRVAVEAQHLGRYAEVCGFRAATHAPLTYPQMLTFPLVMHYMTSRDCPWPAMGTVHLGNAITQHEALQPGDTVRVELHSGELLAHDKGQAFTLHLRILREDRDDCLWQATQTLLRVGVRAPVGPNWTRHDLAQLGPDDAPLSRVATFDAPADTGRRYARVSGDHNPIHLWPITARLLGFRRAIAHGLWTQARALALLHPEGVLPQATLQTQFKRPLWLPSAATVWATAPSAEPRLLEVRDAAGETPHLRARLSLLPHSGNVQP